MSVSRRAQRLVVFIVAGAALYGLGVVHDVWRPKSPSSSPRLTVTVARSADDATVERAVQEAVLVAEAIDAGALTTDEKVVARLARTMDFVAPDADRVERAAHAVDLGLPETDPVLRELLVFDARRRFKAALSVPPPGDAEVEAEARRVAQQRARPVDHWLRRGARKTLSQNAERRLLESAIAARRDEYAVTVRRVGE